MDDEKAIKAVMVCESEVDGAKLWTITKVIYELFLTESGLDVAGECIWNTSNSLRGMVRQIVMMIIL